MVSGGGRPPVLVVGRPWFGGAAHAGRELRASADSETGRTDRTPITSRQRAIQISATATTGMTTKGWIVWAPSGTGSAASTATREPTPAATSRTPNAVGNHPDVWARHPSGTSHRPKKICAVSTP